MASLLKRETSAVGNIRMSAVLLYGKMKQMQLSTARTCVAVGTSASALP